MTEKEIVELYAYYGELYFSLMQWWLSVTVGMVGVAHFFAKKLNLPILTFLIGLYLAYSFYALSLAGINYGASQALISQLIELRALEGVTAVSEQLIATTNSPSSAPSRVFFVCVVGGLFGSVIYVVAAYVNVRRSSNSSNARPLSSRSPGAGVTEE